MTKTPSPQLEIAAHSLQSALAADEGGADRIELCTALSTGGLTPDAGLLDLCLREISIPVHVLIRPRVGNFAYSNAEVATMKASIEQVKNMGVHGVVVGCLSPDAKIDVSDLKILVEAAEGLHITFHRAFDYIADKRIALDKLINLGVDRVLTSGGAASAWEGRQALQQLNFQAIDRIEIMPGAGIDSDNILDLHSIVSAKSYHASAKRLVSTAHPEGLDLGDRMLAHYETDVAEVARLAQSLHAMTK